MAAIQVYKTDTFEIQRQKINQIGEVIANFSGGGNDFAAGNLKLGDGSILDPSLAFTSDPKLGFYKSFPKTLGIVSDNKKVVEFSDQGSNFYQDLIVRRNSLNNAQIRIDNKGTLYDPGFYTNIPLSGGTGLNGSANFTILEFVGSITTEGLDYNEGVYSGIPLIGGSGSGVLVNFDVDGIDGVISSFGSNYAFGAYENIPLTGGSGSGARADILTNESGNVTLVIIRSNGIGYLNNDVLSADFGGGSGFQYTITSYPGLIQNLFFSSRGSGYLPDDILSLRGEITNITSNLQSTTTILVSDSTGIEIGDLVYVTSGTGTLAQGTSVSAISGNNITLSRTPTSSGSAILRFTPPYGYGSSLFEYTITNVGEIQNFDINFGGSGYLEGDILSVDEKLLTSPINFEVVALDLQELVFDGPVPAGYYSVGDTLFVQSSTDSTEVFIVNTSGGNITSIAVSNIDLNGSETIVFDENDDNPRLLASVTNILRYSIDGVLTPNITLTPGETYVFSLQDPSNENHNFSLSAFPGGIWGRSYIQDITSILSVSSRSISVPDTSILFEGMVVNVTSGEGQLITDTRITSIDSSTSLTLSKFPLANGSVVLEFRGIEYSSNVIKSGQQLSIKVTENIPNLYYFDNSPEDEANANAGGIENNESIFTIDVENPRILFGSGFQVTIAELTSEDLISAIPSTGKLSTITLDGVDATLSSANIDNIDSNLITTNAISLSSINSTSDDIELSATNFSINSSVSIGNNITIQNNTGNISTNGNLRTLGSLIVDDIITINNNTISTASGNNLVLSPAPLRTAKVNATTALVIPVGTNNQRPQAALVETGAIRFNTDTQQYEGYNATAASWSSLGGVRDVDGNTYIIAEASVGSNDNTLYFYNNGLNTARLNNTYFDFRSTKRIRSENMSAPSYTEWRANTPVTVGQYLKDKNNIYEVTIAGTTAGSANPPIHTTGIAINGSATLLWSALSISTLTFEEISEVRIGPDGTTPLVISDELVFKNNTLSSKVNDIVIFPSLGKKVEILAQSSLVIPSGDNNQRGSAKVGSIRFNTDIIQYEGYDGTNWSSLGGVRDVDGNTYIIPELGAGTNENILYFYNDDNNTLQLSASGLDFYETDNITSSQSDTLNINVLTVTFNSSEFTIDNSGISTVLTSSKETVDFNLSTGLAAEKLVSFTSDGDIIVNNGYSTGNGVSDITVLNYELKDFELSDIKISTEDLELIRGTINSESTIVYNPTIHVSGKLALIVENVTKNERELIEFNVCHKGSDIFYAEYGNVSTNGELISTAFDFTASNEVRATFTLNTINNDFDDTVNIVAIKTTIKK